MPRYGVPVVRLDADGAFLLAVTQDISRIVVPAKNLQGGDDSALAAVIRPHQHGQPRREVEHRVLVRHEVDELMRSSITTFLAVVARG